MFCLGGHNVRWDETFHYHKRLVVVRSFGSIGDRSLGNDFVHPNESSVQTWTSLGEGRTRICGGTQGIRSDNTSAAARAGEHNHQPRPPRSEEHTPELQS